MREIFLATNIVLIFQKIKFLDTYLDQTDFLAIGIGRNNGGAVGYLVV
jgi:hypothetical protein